MTNPNPIPLPMPRLLLILTLFLFLNQSFIIAFTSNDTVLLQDILKEISATLKWDLEDIKVSRFDLTRKLRFGSANRFEFRVGLGKTQLSAKFSDDVASWKKFRKPSNEFGSLLNDITSFTVLDTFKVEGPFELRVGASEHPKLLLPMNRTHVGFNTVLVGEGITVEIRRAREVSAFHVSNLSSTVNNSSHVTEKEKSEFWSYWDSFCRPLEQIQVFGSSELVAYRTRNPGAHIETKLLSKETIELLGEKCYGAHMYKKRKCPIESLRSRISMLEKLLKSYFGKRLNGLVGLFRGKIKASALIRFQLELEKDLRGNVTKETKAGWRTKPGIKRVWFEVLARVEAGERLKLLMIKEIEPFVTADTAAWSDLSNISFTKLPSLLLPSEALTLDVKW